MKRVRGIKEKERVETRSGAAEKSTKPSRAEGKALGMKEKHRRGVCVCVCVCSNREIPKGVPRQEREVRRTRQAEKGFGLEHNSCRYTGLLLLAGGFLMQPCVCVVQEEHLMLTDQ